MVTSVPYGASAARSSGCDGAVLGAQVLKRIQGLWLLEAIHRVAANGENWQRARELVPEPFNLEGGLELAIPAQRDGHVAKNRQTASRPIRAGRAQPVEAVDDLREAPPVRSPVAHHL